MQLAALWRGIAPPAFTDIGYRLVGIDEWTNGCDVLPSGGKLHLVYAPTSGIGYGAKIENYDACEFYENNYQPKSLTTRLLNCMY